MSNWTPTDHTKCKHKFRPGMNFCDLCGMNRVTADSVADLQHQLAGRRTVTDAQADAALDAWFVGKLPYDAERDEHNRKVRQRLRNRAKAAILQALEVGDK